MSEDSAGRTDSAPQRGAVRPAVTGDGDSEALLGSQSCWARDWLRSVAEARVALERAEALVEIRRERALCVGSATDATPHGKGGENMAEANLVRLVSAEEDLEATYAWAKAELQAFDDMAVANRKCLRGAVLEGLDIAEMKYRIGATDREVAKRLYISRSKLHYNLAAFIDYLDFIGRERAFNPTVGNMKY